MGIDASAEVLRLPRLGPRLLRNDGSDAAIPKARTKLDPTQMRVRDRFRHATSKRDNMACRPTSPLQATFGPKDLALTVCKYSGSQPGAPMNEGRAECRSFDGL